MTTLLNALLIFFLFFQNNYDHLYILYTNDIEGGLSPSEAWWMSPEFPPPLGNAAAAATIIKEKRKEADSLEYGFLIFDTGDIFVGSPIGEFSRGHAVADYFNYCGYDVISPGNHDYDMGVDVLKEFIKNVDAVFLGSNIVYEDTREVVDYLKPYVIIEEKGMRIGIFSLLTQYMEGMTTPERFKNHDVLDELETAKKYVDILKSKDVDLIFCLTGIGLRHDKRLAEKIPGIDVIFGSHSSTALEIPFEDPVNHTIICQSYSHLSSIGFLDLSIDRTTKKIAGYRGELIDLLSDEIESDTTMLALIKEWSDKVEKGFSEVLGYAKDELTRAGFEESPLGDLITDAMREYFGVNIAIHNSGGIRANIPKGEITYNDCYKVDALSNTAVILKMTGGTLIKALEVGFNGHHAIFQISGLKVKYDSQKPAGQRIIEALTEDGALIEPDREYTVVTNSYLAAGGGEYAVFKEAEEIEDTMVHLRDIIALYIKKHSPLEVKTQGRIINLADR